jgi:hypothetical protein
MPERYVEANINHIYVCAVAVNGSWCIICRVTFGVGVVGGIREGVIMAYDGLVVTVY